MGNLGNPFEALLHGPFAADLGFEDFPVVDAVLAGLARIANHDAAFKFIEIDAQLDAMLAAGGQLDGGSAAKSWRVVILRTGWNVDDNGFGVAADVNPVLLALPRPREAVQRGADGHGHGAGTANAGAGRGFRIGHQRDRKSTRLNSSHPSISYAVFCL